MKNSVDKVRFDNIDGLTSFIDRSKFTEKMKKHTPAAKVRIMEAAAPDMLEALVAADQYINPDDRKQLSMLQWNAGLKLATIGIRAAIAKAKGTILASVALLVMALSCTPAHAFDVRATWQLYDTETNSVIRTLSDGQRIDLHTVANRNSLALVANFTYKHSGNNLADHTAWVKWIFTHTENVSQHGKKTYQEDATGGWWPVCGASDGEVNRCSDLSTVGTLTVKAKAWFSDERTTALLGSDSITLRIVDTKPVTRPPSKPSGPVCHGDPEVCKEVVANESWWAALKRLCVSYPGSDFSLGNGAYLRCPE